MTTRAKRSAKVLRIEALVGQDRELLTALVKESVQEVLEGEMTEALGAEAGERTVGRRDYRAGPYLILDARYEKVRVDGVIQSQAVFLAIGINWEGRRQLLGVELSNRSRAGRSQPAGIVDLVRCHQVREPRHVSWGHRESFWRGCIAGSSD